MPQPKKNPHLDSGTPQENDDQELLNIEEYNQIDPEPFDCFPKRVLPLDLFEFKEDINILVPLLPAGKKFGNVERKKFRGMAEAGTLFFSRNQQDEYMQCLRGNLSIAVDDPNLDAGDVAEMFAEEFVLLQDELFANPQKDQLEMLAMALDMLSVFLCVDRRHAEHFVITVHRHRTRQRQRTNAAFIAISLFVQMQEGKVVVDTLGQQALGFFLYDIGMSKVSRLLTDKAQQLRPDEKRRVREHPHWGRELVNRLGLTTPEVEEPIMQHHERLNGSGYPKGLKGEEIGLLGRIMAVADSYVAMITDRPHSPGRDPVEAAAELLKMDKAYDAAVCSSLVKYLQGIRY